MISLKLARQVLRTYRPSGEEDDERDVRAALKYAARNAALGTEFQNQLAFDRAVAAKLESLPLAPEAAEVLAEVARRLESRRPRRFSFRDPAMLAAGLAFLILVGVLGWIFVGQGGTFAGMQEIGEMVELGDRAGADRFTELETPAGALPDWFVMQNFDGFAVPPGFEAAPVVGVRQFKFEELPVAVAAVASPRAMFYVFEAQPLGISIPLGRWRFGSYGPKGQNAFAVCQLGPMAFVVALRDGGEAELKSYLAHWPESRK